MKTTLSTRKIFSLGSLALATSLLVSLLVPSAQANTYSLPNAPTSVTSYIGAKGVVVRWVAGADVAPGVIGGSSVGLLLTKGHEFDDGGVLGTSGFPLFKNL